MYNPTTLVALSGKTVAYDLARSGGPNRDAGEDAMYLIKADGSIVSRRQPSEGRADNWFDRGWFSDRFLEMERQSGDTLVVPQKLDIPQIVSQVALTAGVLIAAGL